MDTSKSENLGPIELAASIKILRQRVAAKENWPVGYVRMIFGGKELEDGRSTPLSLLLFHRAISDDAVEHTLMTYGIQDVSFLFCAKGLADWCRNLLFISSPACLGVYIIEITFLLAFLTSGDVLFGDDGPRFSLLIAK